MPKKHPRTIRYGGGTINETPWGAYSAYIYIDKKRYRSNLRTIMAARQWIDMTANGHRQRMPPLTNLQYADAQKAIAILPSGFSLSDAARAMVASSVRPVDRITLSEALAMFLEAKRVSIAGSTATGYRNIVGQFISAVGDRPVDDITPKIVEGFLLPFSPVNRNTKLRTLKVFFAWAVSNHYSKTTPADSVQKSRQPEPPKGVFSPEDAKKLLHAAEHQCPELCTYLALGMFAGIRPAELEKLPPDAIGRDYIRLDGRITKTADARTISIRPNLRKWLDSYPTHPGSGTILNTQTPYKVLGQLRRNVGIEWPRDGMRHSFATYAYEQSKNAQAVSAEMGHAGTDVFFRHYRALANPGDGAKFFSIVPCFSNDFPKN